MEDFEFEQALRFAKSIRTNSVRIGPTIEVGPSLLSPPGEHARSAPDGVNQSVDGMDADTGGGEPVHSSPLSADQVEELRHWLNKLGPFRKGPFQFFGEPVASHWNSDAKWQHCLPFLESDSRILEGDVLDLGCNNGYYMLRLLELKRSGRIFGLDPAPSFFQQFRFLQAMVQPGHPIAGIRFEPAGHEALRPDGRDSATGHARPGSANGPESDLTRTSDQDTVGDSTTVQGASQQSRFPRQFDSILCWGVIYHRTDPIELLRTIHGALKTGGTLYLESMGIPEDESSSYPRAIVPAGKYAGARGIWHVPDAATLGNYLHRSGFRGIEVLKQWDYSAELNGETGLPVLTEYLDPDRPGFLKDGLPAPIRILVRARR